MYYVLNVPAVIAGTPTAVPGTKYVRQRVVVVIVLPRAPHMRRSRRLVGLPSNLVARVMGAEKSRHWCSSGDR